MGKKKQGQEKSAGSQEASTSGPTGGGGEASGGPAWLGGGAEDPPQCFHPHAQAVNQQGLAQGPLCSAGPAAKGCNLCPQALGGAACLSGQAPNSGGTRRVSLFFLRPQTAASLRQKERHEALSAETRDFVNDLS